MSLPPSMKTGLGLYLVTPPRIDMTLFAPLLDAALKAGPIAALQIRLKTADETQWTLAADLLLPIVRAHGVPAIMTDRCDLARSTGCDGVLLTPEANMSAASAREILGAAAVIGVVCDDDLAVASAAVSGGADFVAFGALSAASSQVPPTPPRAETVQAWSRISATPSLVMGRLRPEGCRAMIAAGASFIAGIGAIWDHPDGPAAGVRDMMAAIAGSSVPNA